MLPKDLDKFCRLFLASVDANKTLECQEEKRKREIYPACHRYNCFVLVCGDGLSAAALYRRRMLASSQSFEAQKRAE
jgi:hypothetical protein